MTSLTSFATRLASATIAAFGLAMVVLATPAAAAQRDCEVWKNGSEIRCLTQGQKNMPGATVTMQNESGGALTFQVQEWQSSCGYPGASINGPSPVRLPADESFDLTLEPFPVGDQYNNGCDELFIFSCKVDGQDVDCDGNVRAVMTPPQVECKGRNTASSQGDIRCLSTFGWAENGQTVNVYNKSSTAVIFSAQQWNSQCGRAGTSLDATKQELQPNESTQFSLSPNQDNNPCSEFFLFNCVDSANSTAVLCARYLKATLQ